ncbi:hypothetical protein FJT64_008738 [Amphibalanus amphitrite]|uniref:STIM1/2 EF-hand domain-containing protein n=1 Tax=Amphibalanus amphitrite TaxID=1232801 RepID=A0A6A4VVL9_AMPAM|nr:hypothetical protein FJT64_008738 [Amphibalanus amphitrite]
MAAVGRAPLRLLAIGAALLLVVPLVICGDDPSLDVADRGSGDSEEERLVYDAIRSLHVQLDDDADGQIDKSESDEGRAPSAAGTAGVRVVFPGAGSLPYRSQLAVPYRSQLAVPYRSQLAVPYRSQLAVPYRSQLAVPYRSQLAVPYRSEPVGHGYLLQC